MDLSIETELEEDGRWIAEVPQLPGVLAYGATAEEAAAKAEVLALRVLAERLEQGESKRGQTPCAHPIGRNRKGIGKGSDPFLHQ
jgi:predicted RNase H-like HicB family nuclease